MKQIKKITKEINSALRKVDVFFILIKSLVILTVTYLILFILKIDPFLAIFPSLIYFISSVFVQGRFDQIRRVERKFKNLDEKLRTARDYQDFDNIILEELEREIIADLRDVKLSDFFLEKKAITLIILLIVSVGASLVIASNDIRILDFNQIVENTMNRFNEEQNNTIESADYTGTTESIMQVGSEQIRVEINPVGIDLDFSELEDDPRYEFSTAFPRDVFISSSASYENEFSEDQQKLIKRYFEKIKKQ